jgi:hypothetical protein
MVYIEVMHLHYLCIPFLFCQLHDIHVLFSYEGKKGEIVALPIQI